MAKTPAQRELELEPPLAGQSESLAFEQQAPFTSPVMMNLRGPDPDEQKARIGQRPGAVKAFSTRIGGDFAVVEMAQINSTYIQPE